MTRSRDVKLQKHGYGKKCGSLNGTVPCKVKCAHECKQHEFGYNCDNQHCIVGGPWSDKWVNICFELNKKNEIACEEPDFGYQTKKLKSKNATYVRERKVLVPKKGKGKPCPHLRENTYCTYGECVDAGVTSVIKSWFG